MAYKLLLADDSITIQKVVELVLAEEDFEIKAVSNGEDALGLMTTYKPDIVLADIEMPKINGYQLCEKIKQNPQTAAVPVILLAGAFEPIDDDLARQVRADDSIIKPFESQELISKLNAALTMSAAEVAEEVSFADSGEEELELAEAVEVGEAEEALATAEEDLWTMEDIPAAREEWSAEPVEEPAEAGPSFQFPDDAVSGGPEVAGPGVPEPREAVVPQSSMPSTRELLDIFERTISERVQSLVSSQEIRDSMLSSVAPVMKSSIEGLLREMLPDLAAKVVRDVMKESLASLSKEVEKVIWETVPDLASTMISKEIEKIKSEF